MSTTMIASADGPHIFPYEDKFVLFNPANHAVLLVNRGALNLIRLAQAGDDLSSHYPELFAQLRLGGVAFDQKAEVDHRPPRSPTQRQFCPTDVALFPTHDCNLRCVYCYADAGSRQVAMANEIAEAAISFVQRNAVRLGLRSTHMAFHGGGEPFFGKGWLLVQHAIRYATDLAEQLGLNLSKYASTNGVLNDKQLHWIVSNNVRLQLSFDGPKLIQNTNRPLANGKGSFPYICRSVAFFESNKHPYTIRTTITDESVQHLPELIDFFSSVSSVKDFHFEALHECGRCSATGAQPPMAEEFVEKMIEAQAYAAKKGRTVWFSQFRLESRAVYCGALAPMFCVTPEGMVSSCYEVSARDDPRGETFFYGRYDRNAPDGFVFDASRIEKLQGRTVDRIAGCETCFAKLSCAGDCRAKKGSDIYTMDPNNDRCEMTRSYLLRQIMTAADKLATGGHPDAAI